ncbi:hypothetical protein ACIHEJ_34585 [Streptomyces sp. NPDC052301]|uniref:hypothetical protein n=1 Tax=Streptomyces sp. NPDC052301 TaxID=3365687 RepID=UPI0037CF1B92
MKLTKRFAAISTAAVAAVLLGAGAAQAQGDGGLLSRLGVTSLLHLPYQMGGGTDGSEKTGDSGNTGGPGHTGDSESMGGSGNSGGSGSGGSSESTTNNNNNNNNNQNPGGPDNNNNNNNNGNNNTNNTTNNNNILTSGGASGAASGGASGGASGAAEGSAGLLSLLGVPPLLQICSPRGQTAQGNNSFSGNQNINCNFS